MVKTAAQSRKPKSSRWLWVLGILALIIAGAAYAYRAPISGYAGAGSAYSARVACSCVYIGNRSLEDCKKDKLKGMELISLSQDSDAKSVTARFPLIKSETATYREGYGCVLEEWQD
jgi:hypothetical protein